MECVFLRDFILARRSKTTTTPISHVGLNSLVCSRLMATSAFRLGSCMPCRKSFPLQHAYVPDTKVRKAHTFHRIHRRFLERGLRVDLTWTISYRTAKKEVGGYTNLLFVPFMLLALHIFCSLGAFLFPSSALVERQIIYFFSREACWSVHPPSCGHYVRNIRVDLVARHLAQPNNPSLRRRRSCHAPVSPVYRYGDF